MEPHAYNELNLDYLGMLPKRYNSQKKILITVDGRITKARFYDGKKLIKEASTRCHPDDRFDFATGARIAFNRLVAEKEEWKHYNGKIICVEAKSSQFTKGKIYVVKDGHVYSNPGHNSPFVYDSLEQINRAFVSKFIKLVED